MGRADAKYKALNGSKLEYSATKEGSFAQLFGMITIPDIGGSPNKIDTTDLDNTKFETNILGLQPAPEFDFEFNCEDPTNVANIKLVYDMAESGDDYYFKLTYANGITVEFVSKVRYTMQGGSTGDLQKFTMHLAPNGEPEVTIPTE